ncbi:MAG: MoaD/ThiS family protein [Saprospiraceae bacterium]
MNIKIVAFGIATDILKARELEINIKDGATVEDVKHYLKATYPPFEKLASLSLAVGEEYRADDYIITKNQEVVIIPPVAGG